MTCMFFNGYIAWIIIVIMIVAPSLLHTHLGMTTYLGIYTPELRQNLTIVTGQFKLTLISSAPIFLLTTLLTAYC